MFSKNLIKLRKENHYTQSDMAKMLKMSRTGYASWEQGLSEPSINDIKLIAITFDITVDELLEIETQEQRNLLIASTDFKKI